MYSTNKINTILFDMDGTVLASEDIFGTSELILLRDYGIDAKPEELHEFRGTSVDKFYPRFISKFALPDNQDTIKKKLLSILYDKFSTDLEYIPGFIDFYNSVISAHNIKTALVTNTSLDLVNHIRQSINLDNFFSVFIAASDVSAPKPSGIPYLQAISQLNSSLDNTIVIEDSETGILSGLNAGCEVIAITTTLNHDQIKKISEDVVVCANYLEIKKYLQARI